GPAMRLSACRSRSSDTWTRRVALTVSIFRSEWGSTPARLSCGPSAAICTWTTRLSARPRTSRRGWNSWPPPAPSCSQPTPPGWLILESGSVSYGKATAYLPVIDLLKAYFNIQDRDDHHDIRAKITNKLLALDRAFESMLPVFLALLDLPVDDSQWRALHPRQRRRRTLDAVKHLLLRESLVQPLLLVFED